MDFVSFILDAQTREVTATGLIVGVVVSIIAGWLVPGRTHKRELAAEHENAEQHREASERKDVAIAKLLEQNSILLGGVRIADHFYRDFMSPVPEATQPGAGVSDVRTPQ